VLAVADVAVRADSLVRRFGDFTAVDGLSFEIVPGEIFGFLGPNGSGKSTTIRMLCGLLLPTEGDALVGGLSVTERPERVREQIGYMSQQFSLYGDLTVLENMEFYGGVYGVTGERLRDRGEALLNRLDLRDERDRLAAALSTGVRQRLALACALLHEPPILFLDEPTSGVDPISRRGFWDLIHDHAEAGTTVFVSTHYMEEAEHCDRLALMNRGRLIALDSPVRLRAAMAAPLLEIQVQDGARAVEALQDAPAITDAALFGRAVHIVTTAPERARATVRERLAAAGVELRDIREVEPSLEDVFVARIRAAGGAPAD
jgi:ABC-2 type transport system ATP-binding protein